MYVNRTVETPNRFYVIEVTLECYPYYTPATRSEPAEGGLNVNDSVCLWERTGRPVRQRRLKDAATQQAIDEVDLSDVLGRHCVF